MSVWWNNVVRKSCFATTDFVLNLFSESLSISSLRRCQFLLYWMTPIECDHCCSCRGSVVVAQQDYCRFFVLSRRWTYYQVATSSASCRSSWIRATSLHSRRSRTVGSRSVAPSHFWHHTVYNANNKWINAFI